MTTPTDIKTILMTDIQNDKLLDANEKEALLNECESFKTNIPEANHTYTRYQDAHYYLDQFLLDTGFVLITNHKDVYIVPKQKFLSFKKLNKKLESLEKKQSNTRFDDNATIVLCVTMRNSKSFLNGLNGHFDDAFTTSMQKATKALAENIYGTRLAYVSGNDILLFLKRTSPSNNKAFLFANNRQKIISTASSIATNAFNQALLSYEDPNRQELLSQKAFTAQFTTTAMTLPQHTKTTMEYLWWKVSLTNIHSIHKLAKTHCPHEKLNHLSTRSLLTLLDDNGTPWKSSLNSHCKYGTLYHSSQEEKWKTWTAYPEETLEALQQSKTVRELKQSPICQALHYKG